MEVLSTSQDDMALTYTDRGEFFVAPRRPTRVKRATLMQGRDMRDLPPIFRSEFMSIVLLSSSAADCDPDPADTQTVDGIISSQSIQALSFRREDTSSADTSADGRIVSSEDQMRAVGPEGTSSLLVQSSDLQSSLLGGPTSQYTPTSGDLRAADDRADAVATEDKAGAQGDHEDSSRGQGSADDRQYVMQDSGRSLPVDTWSDTQQSQDSLSDQHHVQFAEDVLEADDRPLIGNEAAGDENEASGDEQEAAEADQENIDPSNMPLSSLFKTTKGKKNKSKKGKGKDVTETNATDDVTSAKGAQAEEQTPTAASPQASDVTGTSPSDDVKQTEEEKPMADKVEGLPEKTGNDVSGEQTQANSSDTKTDVTSGPQDNAAVLYTTDSRDVNLTVGEGPQLSPSEGGMVEEGGVVEVQPAKADGSLPPETPGREKQSLLHDHNPEGMVCCTIL